MKAICGRYVLVETVRGDTLSGILKDYCATHSVDYVILAEGEKREAFFGPFTRIVDIPPELGSSVPARR